MIKKWFLFSFIVNIFEGLSWNRRKKQLVCWLWRETNRSYSVTVYQVFFWLFICFFKQDMSKKLPVGWVSIVHKQLLPQCASMNKRGLSEGASPDIVICHGFLLITLLDLELTHNWNASVLVQLNQRESKVKETCVGPVFHNLHANAREIRVKWGSLSPTLIQPGHRWYITKRDNKFLQSKHYRSFFLKSEFYYTCRWVDKSTHLTLWQPTACENSITGCDYFPIMGLGWDQTAFRSSLISAWYHKAPKGLL